MAKNNKSKKKNTKRMNQQGNYENKGIHSGYRIGALVLCAVIVVSLVAMYAFI